MAKDKFSFNKILKRKEPQTIFKGVRITSQVMWNLFLIFLTLGIMGAFFVGGAGAGYFASLVRDEPVRSYEEMREDIYDYEEATEIYFANDVYLGDLPSPLERREVSLEEVSQVAIDAVIATEDEYFFEHEGIVPKALLRAVYQDFSNAATQTGGSTLTQQLIKNQVLSSEVTHDRKATEILLAMRLENFFDKDEILEAYLNVVPFGRNSSGTQIAGIQSAAQGIFGVDAAELNLPQAAFIAGLPQSPFAYTPFTGQGEVKENMDAGLNRMRTVLNRMLAGGFITEDEYEEALAYDIRDNLTPPVSGSYEDYPFITDEVRKRAEEKLAIALMEQDDIFIDEIDDDGQIRLLTHRYREEAARSLQRNGYKIYTTIDKDIFDAHTKAVEEFEYFEKDLEETVVDEDGETVDIKRPEEAGSVLLDNRSGAIISFIAGRDHTNSSYNRALFATRPTGSTMKPLLTFAVGFESGDLQPGFVTPDVPTYYSNEDEVNNFDRNHLGIMTAREALVRSRNTPAVREFMKMDSDFAQEKMKQLGLWGYMEKEDGILESSPLGSQSITVEATTSAYTTFANEGKRVEPYMIERIETSDGEVVFEHETVEEEVFSPQTAYLITDVLRGVLESPGTARNLPDYLDFSADWAGKTGTSQGVRDSWFIGYNPNITLSVWIGYDHYQPIPRPGHGGITGLNYSTRSQMLWAELANAAYEINPDLMAPEESFEAPSGIVRETICGISGKLPSDLCREAGLVTTDLFNTEFVPTEEDDSLQRVRYVRVNNGLYKALDSTPSEFTKSGVAVKEEYFDFADEDISDFLPDSAIIIPDIEAPDNGKTPDALSSVRASGGAVTWDEHPEGDVIGYRVYSSSGTLVSSVKWDESFRYSGSGGTYYVTAVDVAGRESSRSSEVTIGGGSSPDEDEDEDGSDDGSDNNEDGREDNDAEDNNEDDNNGGNNNDDNNQDSDSGSNSNNSGNNGNNGNNGNGNNDSNNSDDANNDNDNDGNDDNGNNNDNED